jgi:hypothetical protein
VGSTRELAGREEAGSMPGRREAPRNGGGSMPGREESGSMCVRVQGGCKGRPGRVAGRARE